MRDACATKNIFNFNFNFNLEGKTVPDRKSSQQIMRVNGPIPYSESYSSSGRGLQCPTSELREFNGYIQSSAISGMTML
eukprot:1190552-Prorocentrum_minimum.AAC.3